MNQKGVAQVYLLIILLILGVGGYFYLQSKEALPHFSKSSTKPVVPQPTPSITPTKATDETANWKTYTNAKYNYSLKYPANGLKEGTDDKITFWESPDKGILEGTEAPPKTPYVTIEVGSISGGASLDTYVTSKEITPGNQEFTKFIGKKEILLTGFKGTEYTYEFSENGTGWYPIYFQSGSNIFRISSQKQYVKDGSFFDKILSTFKFTN